MAKSWENIQPDYLVDCEDKHEKYLWKQSIHHIQIKDKILNEEVGRGIKEVLKMSFLL